MTNAIRRLRPCRRVHLIVPMLTVAFAATAGAADWPQWRGADGTGISTETDWTPQGRADDAWSASVGLGYSTVSVANGRLYTMGFDEEAGLDSIFCFDAATGREIWKHSYPSKIWNQFHGGGTLTTPSIDGNVVYALNREGRFVCLDAADGTVRWKRQLMEGDLDLSYPKWGFAASPLVLEDMVVLNLGRVIAFERGTGKILWRSKNYGHAYATPAVMDVAGARLLAVFNSDGLAIINRADGTERAVHEWKTKYDTNCATPIVMGNRVFISSGLNRGCALLELGADGLTVQWENKRMRTHMTGCILWNGHLYGFDEAMLKCIDLDGNEKWKARGTGKGSLMVADGKLIFMTGKGELVIAEATADAYRELSRTKCLSGGVYWTMPILVDGRIYCRNSEGSIVCRDHRPTAADDTGS